MKKPMRNALIDFLIASLLGLLIYILADLIFLAPALLDSIDDTQSFLYIATMTLNYVITFVPFFFILLALFVKKRQSKTEYLKGMTGRTYDFATDLKDLLQGEGKWYWGIFAILEAPALVIAIVGVPVGALLTVTMPMAAVWLLGTKGIVGAILGFLISFVLFGLIFILGVTGKHRKWCAERLSV